MHFFKFVLILFAISTSLLFSQEDEILLQRFSDSVFYGGINIISNIESELSDFEIINKRYSERVIDVSSYKELTETILGIPLDRGYYFPMLYLNGISPITNYEGVYLNPEFMLSWGDLVTVDTLLFEGIERTSHKLLRRELQGLVGTVYRSGTAKNVIDNLRRYPFLEVIDCDEIVRTRDGKYGLLMKIEEKLDNEFSGVLGYNPTKGDEKGFFTGAIDLKLLNLSGTGRQLIIYWSKINRYSQQLQLRYFEPWIWKTSLYGEGEFQQILRDTLVVIRKFRFGLGKRFSTLSHFQFNFQSESTIPTPGGRSIFNLYPTNTTLIGLEYERDSRNRQHNPESGSIIHMETLFGNRKKSGSLSKWQFQSELDCEFNYHIWTQWVASFGGHFKGKWLSKGKVSYSEYYWFGGAKSLRGYPQDFFNGSEISWISIELRWIIGMLRRIHVFADCGFHKNPISTGKEIGFPYSYGIGMRLDSRMGVIGLDYALGEGDTFSTAKIHLHIGNRF